MNLLINVRYRGVLSYTVQCVSEESTFKGGDEMLNTVWSIIVPII